MITLAVPAEAGEAQGRYVTGNGAVGVWCASAPHGILPQGDPSEHPSPAGWLLSGEPECAAGDAVNAATGDAQDFAYGLVYLTLPAGTTQFLFEIQDAFVFTPLVTINIGGLTIEGCGAAIGTTFAPLAEDTAVTVFIDAGLGPGMLPCWGSAGSYTASWS